MSSGARIFITYRRADSAGWARQLHGDLATRFGAERVFRDVAIEPGVDYVDHIERVMDACDVCVAVIGPRWVDAETADGRRRLDDPEDLVRLEIQRALERPDVRVIPVLVDGARMPAEDDLPPALHRLARRNACELSDSRWDYDVEKLCRCLRHVLGQSTLEQAPARRRSEHGWQAVEPVGLPLPLRSALTLLVAAGAAAIAAVRLSDPLSGRGSGHWGRLAGYATERGVLWAVVGAVVAAVAATAIDRGRRPLGSALAGAVAGGLGGAAGGAAYMAIKVFAGATEQHSHWLLMAVTIALPGLALAAVLAAMAQARRGECLAAALAGAAAAALVTGGDRGDRLTLQVLLVVGATVAVLAAPAHRALLPRHAAAVQPPFDART